MGRSELATPVALAWTLAQPGVSAPIFGASKLEQLRENLQALDIVLSPEQLQTLREVSAPDAVAFFSPELKRIVLWRAPVEPSAHNAYSNVGAGA